MATQPLDVIAKSPMRMAQYVIVALCCLINVTEGFDMLSLAYAAPVLSKEWATPPALLGLTFSAASTGLAIAAFLLAPLADRIGRRPIMLVAMVAITLSHAFSSITHSIYVLMALRLLMGLGLGILVVSLNVLVSEYSNDHRRNVLLAALHAGFTIGMMLGGVCAALLLKPYGWRAIFTVGAVMNLGIGILLFFSLRESPSFLISRQPARALEKLNHILRGLGHAPLDALPPPPKAKDKKGLLAAFLSPADRFPNLMIWLAAFAYSIVGYFLMNWKPKVLVDAGLTPVQASWAGVLQSCLGLLGHMSIGAFTKPGKERQMTALYFVLLSVSLVIFGNVSGSVPLLIAMAALLNFFTVGSYTGVFLVAISTYRAEVRTLGVGFVVGMSRIGAMVGPLLGGVLLNMGFDRAATFGVFAAISVVPILTMLLLSRAGGGSNEPRLAPAE